MYIKHTRCYLLKSVLWYVCKDRPVNDDQLLSVHLIPVVVNFDGVWNVFLWVLLHYLVFNIPILTALEGHLCWCPF